MQVRRIALTLTAAAMLTTALAPAAMAADDTSVAVTGGTLSITNPLVANFTAVTLNGAPQTTAATMDGFSVTDGRGTGVGWNVTVQATQFSGGVTPTRTLGTGSLSLLAPTVAAANTTSSAPPTMTAGPYAIDGSTVKIASAAAAAGMGTYDFTQGGALSLAIPASAYAATYTSTVTVSVVTGP